MRDGFTFDTGVLIALERREPRARKIFELAKYHGIRPIVPAAVVTEWWRARTDHREEILGGVRVDPLSTPVAKAAGEALAAVRGATAIDAIVMATAARRGAIVFTSDVADLTRLATHFRSVRVLGI